MYIAIAFEARIGIALRTEETVYGVDENRTMTLVHASCSWLSDISWLRLLVQTAVSRG